ncbi:MAG: hypothetical protein K1X47_14675 [Cyclobacteriaceae bacterium]|nr:hypothetical protein [Cyclobacteriaceae bacterium]
MKKLTYMVIVLILGIGSIAMTSFTHKSESKAANSAKVEKEVGSGYALSSNSQF